MPRQPLKKVMPPEVPVVVQPDFVTLHLRPIPKREYDAAYRTGLVAERDLARGFGFLCREGSELFMYVTHDGKYWRGIYLYDQEYFTNRQVEYGLEITLTEAAA